jgi:hypothetical protein
MPGRRGDDEGVVTGLSTGVDPRQLPAGHLAGVVVAFADPRPLANVVRLGELHGLGGLDRTDPFDRGVGRSGGGSEATTSHTGEVRRDLVSAAGIAVSLWVSVCAFSDA